MGRHFFRQCGKGRAVFLHVYLAFKRTDPPWSHEDFFTEAMQRVPLGSEAGFIAAVGSVPEFGMYSFRAFLERVPENWKGRPAISHALAEALKVLLSPLLHGSEEKPLL